MELCDFSLRRASSSFSTALAGTQGDPVYVSDSLPTRQGIAFFHLSSRLKTALFLSQPPSSLRTSELKGFS